MMVLCGNPDAKYFEEMQNYEIQEESLGRHAVGRGTRERYGAAVLCGGSDADEQQPPKGRQCLPNIQCGGFGLYAG